MSTKPKTKADEEELEALLEAARRANWDALHGPRHLRSGRFRPEDLKPDAGGAESAEPELACAEKLEAQE